VSLKTPPPPMVIWLIFHQVHMDYQFFLQKVTLIVMRERGPRLGVVKSKYMGLVARYRQVR
jgi:hypothetical protein